jgi:hypothetical protein
VIQGDWNREDQEVPFLLWFEVTQLDAVRESIVEAMSPYKAILDDLPWMKPER